MADPFSKAKRSWVMSRIRSKDTKPELIVRSMLHRCGLRFSLRRKDLPGQPDIVMPKHNMVVFVHGCYWHRHRGCKAARMPAANQEFWQDKFRKTQKRDRQHKKEIEKAGWRVVVIWECQVMKEPEKVLNRILSHIESSDDIKTFAVPPRKDLLRVAEKKLQYSLNQIEKKARSSNSRQ